MPIEFRTYVEQNYFQSIWTGAPTDAEMLEAYEEFYGSRDWTPGMNELADLTIVDLGSVTAGGLRSLAKMVENTLKSRDVEFSKLAVVTSSDLQFGLARLYGSWADQSPESIRIFKSMKEARDWILGDGQ